jgi:hypothetical protein
LRSGRVVGIERPRCEREHLVTIIQTSRLVIASLQETWRLASQSPQGAG